MWICILLYWTDLGWTDRKLRTQEERSRTESSRDRNEERIEATSYEMVGYVGTVFTIPLGDPIWFQYVSNCSGTFNKSSLKSPQRGHDGEVALPNVLGVHLSMAAPLQPWPFQKKRGLPDPKHVNGRSPN